MPTLGAPSARPLRRWLSRSCRDRPETFFWHRLKLCVEPPSLVPTTSTTHPAVVQWGLRQTGGRGESFRKAREGEESRRHGRLMERTDVARVRARSFVVPSKDGGLELPLSELCIG